MSKKVKRVLKGVAGLGAAFGGAEAFTDADVVYANELQQTSESLLGSKSIVRVTFV